MKTLLTLSLITFTAAVALGDSPTQTKEKIPTPSCDRIDYSHPDAYVSLNAHFGNKEHILKVAATLGGKTPEEKLVAIFNWIHSNLVHKADVPYYDWRDFDRLVRDGNYGGCAEHSLLFGALSRACGIPTVWVKTLDAEWIRDFRTHGKEGSWNGHVFLEVFIHDRWTLLDDVQMVLYHDYDPKSRILPGNRYAYDKGGDPFDVVLSSRWELWKAQIRATFRDFDLSKLPVGTGKSLMSGTIYGGPRKYPAVFIFYSERTAPTVQALSKTLFPKLTLHLTGRLHSLANYQEQFTRWAKPGDTVVLLLLAGETDRVPAEYRDLLPKPWSEMEAEAARKGAVRYDGESRKRHLIVLVGKSETELSGLVQKIQW